MTASACLFLLQLRSSEHCQIPAALLPRLCHHQYNTITDQNFVWVAYDASASSSTVNRVGRRSKEISTNSVGIDA